MTFSWELLKSYENFSWVFPSWEFDFSHENQNAHETFLRSREIMYPDGTTFIILFQVQLVQCKLCQLFHFVYKVRPITESMLERDHQLSSLAHVIDVKTASLWCRFAIPSVRSVWEQQLVLNRKQSCTYSTVLALLPLPTLWALLHWIRFYASFAGPFISVTSNKSSPSPSPLAIPSAVWEPCDRCLTLGSQM